MASRGFPSFAIAAPRYRNNPVFLTAARIGAFVAIGFGYESVITGRGKSDNKR